MNINKFTQNSLQAVQNCEKIAYDYGNQEIAQEHLLYALVTQNDSLILKLLEKMNIQGALFTNRVEEALAKRPKVQGGQVFVGQDLNNVLILSLIHIWCGCAGQRRGGTGGRDVSADRRIKGSQGPDIGNAG